LEAHPNNKNMYNLDLLDWFSKYKRTSKRLHDTTLNLYILLNNGVALTERFWYLPSARNRFVKLPPDPHFIDPAGPIIYRHSGNYNKKTTLWMAKN
jgi:hypothetical protein